MEEHKTERKQAEDKSVFLGFGDDVAVDPHGHSTAGKVGVQRIPVVDILDVKISNRLVQQTRSRPRRRLSRIIAIVESAAHPNADVIGESHIVHKHPSNRSADGRGAHGDGGGVGGTGGKGDVGSAATGNSLSYGVDVDGVSAGKQGREGDSLVGRRVGLVNVAGGLPAINARIAARSAESAGACDAGAAGEDPKSLVGAILAGIDIEDQLRLGFAPPPPSPQRQTTAANKEKLRLILIYCFITVPVKNLFVSNRSAATCQSLKREKKEKS